MTMVIIIMMMMTINNTIEFETTVIAPENIGALIIILVTQGTYDYHFIFKKLTKEFKRQFQTFSVLIKKEVKRIDMKGEKIKPKNIVCEIKFIDSLRFISSSLLSLVDNLVEGFYKGRYIDCKSCSEYLNVRDRLLLSNFSQGNKSYKKSLIEIYQRDLRVCMNSVTEILINFV